MLFEQYLEQRMLREMGYRFGGESVDDFTAKAFMVIHEEYEEKLKKQREQAARLAGTKRGR